MIDPLRERVPERFETERLIVRCPHGGDAPAMNAAVLESLDALRVYLPWAQSTPSLAQNEADCRRMQAKYLLREDLPMFIFERSAADGEGRFVGGIGLHRIDWDVRRFEIGYWCRVSLQGRGYITEAARGIACLAFGELGARRVEIRTDATNERSWRVAQRLDFPLEGILRCDSKTPRGAERDTRLYARTEGWAHPQANATAA